MGNKMTITKKQEKIIITTILMLNNMILFCFCGSELRIRKVIKSYKQYYILQVDEKETNRWNNDYRYVIYDLKINKVLRPGTCNRIDINIELNNIINQE